MKYKETDRKELFIGAVYCILVFVLTYITIVIFH